MDRVTQRERLRRTFDAAAADYQDARPEYPDALYAELLAVTGVRPGADALCDVGAASGKATLPLARRGFAVTCVELGTALADEAWRNLAPYEQVTVVNSAFETWQPSVTQWFGLVFAATAWHWIDPAVKYAKAASLLRPGGHLALWEAVHVIPADGDPIFAEIQDVYDQIGEGMPTGWVSPTTQTLPSLEPEIAATGLFTDVVTSRFQWEIRYTADSYLRLLDTFSNHIAMEPWQRTRLHGEIRRFLAQRPDGLLRLHWGAVLNVARRA